MSYSEERHEYPPKVEARIAEQEAAAQGDAADRWFAFGYDLAKLALTHKQLVGDEATDFLNQLHDNSHLVNEASHPYHADAGFVDGMNAALKDFSKREAA
jgi:hypothetical protein